MARPGGNPDFGKGKKYYLTTAREHPLNKKLTIRMDEPMYDRLMQMSERAEFIRQAIQEKLDSLEVIAS